MNTSSHKKLRAYFKLQHKYLDKDEPWLVILEATEFSVSGMYHTMLQAWHDIKYQFHL